MKNIVVMSAVGLVLLGFGCATKNISPTTVATGTDGTVLPPVETVVGAWYVALDLPEGWVMVPPYDENSTKGPATAEVTSDLSDVIIQSTSKAIALTGTSALPESEYVSDNYTFIHVFRMEKRVRVPSEAIDMGNGFFSLQKDINTIYYFVGEGATYKYIVYQKNNDPALAEEVILSTIENDTLTAE